MEINKMISAVKETILKYHMLQHGNSVLVGVSGGADSIGLLHLLIRLSSQFNLRLAIAHLDHGLRGAESDRDAHFVRNVANSFGLPFYYKKVDVKSFSSSQKLSLEEAGRILRHKYLFETADKHGFDKIALGHHQNDRAETMLINILRGSGPQGISGIPPKREKVIRPLINISRSHIEDFLQSNDIAYMTDSSNNDLKFLRNQIRHHLIPLLASHYNPDIVGTLSRTAEILQDEQNWLESLIEPLFKSIILSEDSTKIVLSIQRLKKIPVAATRRIIRKALWHARGDLQGVGFKHVDVILGLIAGDNCRTQADFPGPVQIIRENEELMIIRKNAKLKATHPVNSIEMEFGRVEYQINSPQSFYIKEIDHFIRLTELTSKEVLQLKDTNFSNSDSLVGYMDMDYLSFPFTVRFFRPGDRFRPLGLNGFQKLKKFFINNKVPFKQRKKIPILEYKGQIIWVAGYRIDDSVKVKPSTQRVIKASLNAGTTV